MGPRNAAGIWGMAGMLAVLACGGDDGGGASGTEASGGTTGSAGTVDDGPDSGNSMTMTSPTSASSGVDSTADSATTGPPTCDSVGVAGRVTDDAGTPLADARVTLFSPDFALFREVRSAGDGGYAIDDVPLGAYRLGGSLRDRAYVETDVEISDTCVDADLELGPEIEEGRWTVIGDTAPEYFAGTPSATLLADGQVMYCHNTQDPVVVDPADGAKSYPAEGPSSQGCHMQTMLSDGRILFVGGQDPDDPGSFVNGVPYVKTYDPVADAWEEWPDMNEPRWYPTVFRFADETIMACGGGQPPDAARTDTCEILDFANGQWSYTGPMVQPTEYSPAVLLPSGELLMTWSPPQLYDRARGTWQATGDFVQPNRGWPDHSDHTLVRMPDGTPVAIGVGAAAGDAMVEIYDRASESWSVGASPDVVRSQPEVVALPDARVLAAGGFWESGAPIDFDPGWPAVANADLYDAELDRWRSVAPMSLPREYHALTLLVPDGRVLTSSGASNQATGATNNNEVEAFEPPYLFRGPRPRIESLSTDVLARGTTVQLAFSRTEAPTAVVLLGTQAVTHWVDGGVSRHASLPFEQTEADQLDVSIPLDELEVPTGYYILFLMVDDIPSEGQIVRVTS